MQTEQAAGFEIVADGFDFVEAPRITADGDVWFSDLTGGGIYRKQAGKQVETMHADRQWVGGMVFDQSGHVICGGRGGIIALDPATGRSIDILTEIEGQPIIAVNDMEADGRGGLFAGTIDFVSIMEKGEDPSPGVFFHLSAAGEVTVLRRDVFASNGIAFSPCGQFLYHSETSRGIWRYPLGANGLPEPGQLLVEEEAADGLACDRDGNLWLACWSTGRLNQYSADGTALQALTFPAPHVVSLAFGSNDPNSLYIATGGNEDAPRAGGVLRMPVEIAGLASAQTKLGCLAGSDQVR